MSEKLQAIYQVLSDLSRETSPDEAKALLRQAMPLLVDLSPTELEDALDWIRDRTSLSRSWLRAYKKEIKEMRQSARQTPADETLEEVPDPEALRQAAAPLLVSGSILNRTLEAMEALGLVGQRREAALLYLAVTSRIFEEPVNVVVKGTSSGGKSFLTAAVLRLFPATAFYELTAMSERALAYSQEPLAHRFMVVYEAAGLSSELAQYLLRSLLSEGRVKYETVDKIGKKLTPRLIEREGPTGFITTTTAVSLHNENETRYLSIEVDDSKRQTQAVLYRQGMEAAKLNDKEEVDLTPFHALQTLLEIERPLVVVPFAPEVAANCDAEAVRLRRDFPHVLTLIKAHAALQAHQRPRDEHGRVVALAEDYEVVYHLVADIIAHGTGAKVDSRVRELVAVVERLAGEDGVTVKSVAQELAMHESSAWRLVQKALKKGFLINRETRPRAPAKLVVGDPIPPDGTVIPCPETIFKNYHSSPPENGKTAQTSSETYAKSGDEVFTADENLVKTATLAEAEAQASPLGEEILDAEVAEGEILAPEVLEL